MFMPGMLSKIIEYQTLFPTGSLSPWTRPEIMLSLVLGLKTNFTALARIERQKLCGENKNVLTPPAESVIGGLVKHRPAFG
jgi:hypothetical protein